MSTKRAKAKTTDTNPEHPETDAMQQNGAVQIDEATDHAEQEDAPETPEANADLNNAFLEEVDALASRRQRAHQRIKEHREGIRIIEEEIRTIEEELKVVTRIARRFGASPPSALQQTIRGSTVAGRMRLKAGQGQQGQLILDLLKQHPEGLRVREIQSALADQFDTHSADRYTAISQGLARLKKKGHIELNDGIYRLTTNLVTSTT